MEFTFTIKSIYDELKRVNSKMLENDEDYARVINHVGYNKGDTVKAHRLEQKRLWTEHDAIWVYMALGRYRSQLLAVHNIDYTMLENPFGKGDEASSVLTLEDLNNLEWDDGKKVNTKNGPKLVKRATNIPTDIDQNELFWNAFWVLWKENQQTIKWTLNISPEYPNQWNHYKRCLVKWTDDTTPNIMKMDVQAKAVERMIDLKYASYLLPYQPTHVKNLIYAFHNNNGTVLDGSDTGTGKTFTAIDVALELKRRMLIVCPKSVIPSWISALKHFGITDDQINTEGGSYFIVNYELLRLGKYIHNRYSTKGKYFKKYGIPKLMYDKVDCPFLTYTEGHRYKSENYEWKLPSDFLLVFDEVHRCKHRKTSNTAMLISAKMAGVHILGMSATIAENPMRLNGIGFVFGLYSHIAGFYDWAKLHGCNDGGYNNSWQFNGNPAEMVKIYNEIYLDNKRGARMAIADLGDLFPETQITSEIYNMNANANKIQKIYDQMEEELAELRNRSARDYPRSILTIILRARQQIELLKVPTYIEMTEDYIESGNSVAIFVNFTQTLNAIASHFKTKCVIRGGQKPEERQHWINQFQADKERVIVCNLNAGGVGISLHDTHGNHPRIAIISPTYSAQDLLQAKGRVWRGGGKSISIQRIIFCANTIEEKMCQSVASKIHNLNLLNDGDLTKGLNIDPQVFVDYRAISEEVHDDLANMDEMMESGEWQKKYTVKNTEGLNIIL